MTMPTGRPQPEERPADARQSWELDGSQWRLWTDQIGYLRGTRSTRTSRDWSARRVGLSVAAQRLSPLGTPVLALLKRVSAVRICPRAPPHTRRSTAIFAPDPVGLSSHVFLLGARRVPESTVHPLHGSPVGVGSHQVAVSVQGQLGCGVPQPRRHRLDVDACRDPHACSGVREVVRPAAQRCRAPLHRSSPVLNPQVATLRRRNRRSSGAPLRPKVRSRAAPAPTAGRAESVGSWSAAGPGQLAEPSQASPAEDASIGRWLGAGGGACEPAGLTEIPRGGGAHAHPGTALRPAPGEHSHHLPQTWTSLGAGWGGASRPCPLRRQFRG